MEAKYTILEWRNGLRQSGISGAGCPRMEEVPRAPCRARCIYFLITKIGLLKSCISRHRSPGVEMHVRYPAGHPTDLRSNGGFNISGAAEEGPHSCQIMRLPCTIDHPSRQSHFVVRTCVHPHSETTANRGSGTTHRPRDGHNNRRGKIPTICCAARCVIIAFLVSPRECLLFCRL